MANIALAESDPWRSFKVIGNFVNTIFQNKLRDYRYRAPKSMLKAGVACASHSIVECGIARFLCAMRVFDVRASS